MANNAFDIKRLLHTAKTTKRFWVPLFVLTAMAACSAIIFVPKKYQSSAQVLIVKPLQVLGTNPVSGLVFNINTELATIRERITSYLFIDMIARKLNLGKGLPPESQTYQAMIEGIRRSIDLRVKGSDLFTITVQADSAVKARDLTSTIVNEYITMASVRMDTNTEGMKRTLQSELTAAERDLRLANEKIKQYKEQHPNEIPDVQAEQSRRLRDQKHSYDALQGKLDGLRNTLSMMQEHFKKTPENISEYSTSDNNALAGLLRNKKNLESQKELLLHDYTEQHWKIKDLNTMLSQVEKEIASETGKTTSTEKLIPNPNFQAMQLQITAVQAEIAQTEAAMAKIRPEIATLEAWQKQVPMRQQELDVINREAATARDRAENYRKRLYDVQTTEQTVNRGQGLSYQINDPPRLQETPVAPNPKKFVMLGIAAGCAVSGALIYLLMLLDSAIRSVDEARRLLQMPVLGVVQRVMTVTDTIRMRRRTRMRRLGFSFGAAALVCVVALGMTVLREPIKQQVEHVRSMLANR